MRAGGSGIAESPGTHLPPSFCSAFLALAFIPKAMVRCGCKAPAIMSPFQAVGGMAGEGGA